MSAGSVFSDNFRKSRHGKWEGESVMTTAHSIVLYGLTTCAHCRRTIEFLEKNNISFDRVFVDTMEGETRADTLRKVKSYNPRISFPTIVVDGGEHIIVGFQQDEIKEFCAP